MGITARSWNLTVSFWVPLVTLLLSLPYLEGATSEKKGPQVVRNSLFALAERQIEAQELNEAHETFTQLIESYPTDVQILIRFGYLLLKKDGFKQAESIFKKAKKLDKNNVTAIVGLGLVYAETPTTGLEAYYNFRRAIGEAKRAVKIDSTYGPAYRLLGQTYEHFQEDHEKALNYYQKYVDLEPDNPEGLYHFGLACVLNKNYEKIDAYITPYLKNHPEETQLLPLVAQSHFGLDRNKQALIFFERYLLHIDGRERQLYADITNVASEKELQDYRTTSGQERQAYLEQFWSRRDPDILTKINERIIEHYRRVWYTRSFLAQNAYPWDKRGEIYIRYGEPDYRSRSINRQFIQTPEVEAVRTRMAVDIYGPEAAFLTFTGPVFPIRSYNDPFGTNFKRNFEEPGPAETRTAEEAAAFGGDPATSGDAEVMSNPSAEWAWQRGPGFDMNPLVGESLTSLDRETLDVQLRLQFGDYAPVTMDNEFGTVPWETWTYVQLQGGIEITFTDESSNGNFEFAPLPDASFEDKNVSYIQRMVEYSPEVIVQNVVARIPDFYSPSLQVDALNFYFDTANFQGSNGQTTLEVYYGIPPEQIQVEQKADSTFVHVQCAFALADEGHTTIYRNAQDIFFQGIFDFQNSNGEFIPELLKSEVPPGNYELQVQLKDLKSGRTGLYRQSLEIKNYSLSKLQISDIQLASIINDIGPSEKFRKNEIWILPMPTRNYRKDQKVYAYFEIYHLKKNEFGQTSYKVQYLVRSSSMPSIGVFGAVTSGFRNIIKRSKPQVSITYEQSGREQSEHEYVEIDLSKAKKGVNELEVTITDLVSGEQVNQEVRFRYGK